MSCGMGIVSCIVFYVSSKIFSQYHYPHFRPSLDLTSFLRSVYLFLIEKVYVVSGTTLPRLQSKMYLLCAFSIALYLVIIILMVLGKFRSEVGRKEGGRRAWIEGRRDSTG